MESPTFPRILVLVLLLSGTCMVMVPSANAEGRCQEILDPHSCTLASCRQACYQRHTAAQQASAQCEASRSNYRCVCFFNC